MCCAALVARTSVSRRIDGRARSPFSQGLGGSNVAHAVATQATHAASRRSMPREQRTYAGLDRVALVVAEAFLDRDDDAVAIDQERTRHFLDAVRRGSRALRVEHHGERGRDVAQELLRVGASLVDVDTDDREAV